MNQIKFSFFTFFLILNFHVIIFCNNKNCEISVASFESKANEDKLSLIYSKPIIPEFIRYILPERLVIRFPNCKPLISLKNLNGKKGEIIDNFEIQTNQTDNKDIPATVVTIYLSKPTYIKPIQLTSLNTVIYFTSAQDNNKSFVRKSSHITNINSISSTNSETIIISTDNFLQPEVYTTSNPSRIIFAFENTIPEYNSLQQCKNIKSSLVKNIEIFGFKQSPNLNKIDENQYLFTTQPTPLQRDIFGIPSISRTLPQTLLVITPSNDVEYEITHPNLTKIFITLKLIDTQKPDENLSMCNCQTPFQIPQYKLEE